MYKSTPYRRVLLCLLCFLVSVSAAAVNRKSVSERDENGDFMIVGDWTEDKVLRYDAASGAFVDTLVAKHRGGLNDPVGVLFGKSDHHIYVSTGQFSGTGQLRGVARYHGGTGAFLGVTESGRLTSPRGIIFGRDGNLYVADATYGTDGGIVGRVVRFNGSTGAYMDDFVPAGHGGLGRPGGLLFGPSGKVNGRLDLFVASSGNNKILRFDGATGAFVSEFVSGEYGWLDHQTSMTFGPDGNLYVANWAAGVGHMAILRFQGPSGASPGAPMPSAGNFGADFVPPGHGGLLAPVGVLFGPDGNGDGHFDLYVTNSNYHGANSLAKENTGTVKRFDGATGAFIDTFIDIGSGGLREPFFLTFTRTDPVTLEYTGI